MVQRKNWKENAARSNFCDKHYMSLAASHGSCRGRKNCVVHFNGSYFSRLLLFRGKFEFVKCTSY